MSNRIAPRVVRDVLRKRVMDRFMRDNLVVVKPKKNASKIRK